MLSKIKLEYDISLPEQKMTSTLLKGLNFLFVPNNTAKITSIRKSLARSHGAVLNSNFRPGITSQVLVDTVIVRNPSQILGKMDIKRADWAKFQHQVSILDQKWLLKSIEEGNLLDMKEFEIKIPEERIEKTMKPPTKKMKIEQLESSTSHASKTKKELLEENINLPNIDSNPNQETMNLLKEMANECEVKADSFKARAYRIAVDSLSKTKEFITTFDQAIKLPGVGKSIAAKIEEITQTHQLGALNTLQHSELSKLMRLFKGIYGVGNVFAQKWIKEGCRSIEDVTNRDDLTHNQRLGIQYYKDWNERIIRNECTSHKQYILDIAKIIDPEVEMIIGGSYRRGMPDCGDIDFIITKPNAEIEELRKFLDTLLAELKKTGYYKCALTISVSNKWMGGCGLPKGYLKNMGLDMSWDKCRRVDFLLVPWKSRGAALIYFTGNDDFNKKIRLRALNRGMGLNESGLFKRVKDSKGGEKLERVEAFDERKIFEILEVKWREPTERNIGSNINIATKPERVLRASTANKRKQ